MFSAAPPPPSFFPFWYVLYWLCDCSLASNEQVTIYTNRINFDFWCSKGRNGHIPFRDSKLTRILQSSLGGNAKTAIICTMSPARSHVEQTRNTLLFASCAKEVSTNAQVNVVMSDKALVKHLQRELSRLESELRSSGTTSVTSDSSSLLREKDLLVEKVMNRLKPFGSSGVSICYINYSLFSLVSNMGFHSQVYSQQYQI